MKFIYCRSEKSRGNYSVPSDSRVHTAGNAMFFPDSWCVSLSDVDSFYFDSARTFTWSFLLFFYTFTHCRAKLDKVNKQFRWHDKKSNTPIWTLQFENAHRKTVRIALMQRVKNCTVNRCEERMAPTKERQNTEDSIECSGNFAAKNNKNYQEGFLCQE